MMRLLPRPTATGSRPLRTSTVVTCPYNGHQVGWCRGLCAPMADLGACGRPAPHAIVSRLQLALAAGKATGT
ncbi:MAG: hypothetical protein V1750_05215 [Acidobacteriota bacterium]